jgi:hypothetical protein
MRPPWRRGLAGHVAIHKKLNGSFVTWLDHVTEVPPLD